MLLPRTMFLAQPGPWYARKAFRCVAGALLAGIVAAVVTAMPTSSVPFHGIPVPFTVAGSSLRGSVSFLERRGSVDVYEVDFRSSSEERLEPDRIYLVHIPSGPDIQDVPLDRVMTTVSGIHAVDYYGYRYSDAAATMERNFSLALRFQDRFPGQFFASAAARTADASRGNILSAFEAQSGITFARTDDVPDAVRMDPAGGLYMVVVNEPGGAILAPRQG